MLLIPCFLFGLLGSLAWASPHGRNACPSGTLTNKERSQWYCYKFYEQPFTFQEAEGLCQDQNGHLASLKSNKDSSLIGAYVSKHNMDNYNVWIGLQRDEDSNLNTGWRWTDGSLDRYRQWSHREPNNESSKEYCVVLYPSSGHLTWNDVSCSSKYPFLCKWKLS